MSVISTKAPTRLAVGAEVRQQVDLDPARARRRRGQLALVDRRPALPVSMRSTCGWISRAASAPITSAKVRPRIERSSRPKASRVLLVGEQAAEAARLVVRDQHRHVVGQQRGTARPSLRAVICARAAARARRAARRRSVACRRCQLARALDPAPSCRRHAARAAASVKSRRRPSCVQQLGARRGRSARRTSRGRAPRRARAP